MERPEFEGRKIIVFGASSGIGRACAIQLGARGAKVILVGRNQERLKEAASHIPQLCPATYQILTRPRR